MHEHVLVQLTSIIVLGIGAQWIASALRLPSILILLIFGFIVGPLTGFLNPDELLGDLLFPIVSLSVAIILFEGGLSLKFSELRGIGTVVQRLISIGVIVTWLVGAAAAYFILGLDVALSVLLGSILVVSGPTVVSPLLREVRPIHRVGSALKWEGIFIDPVGATLAVLVFEALLVGDFQELTLISLVGGILKTIVVGVGIGILTSVSMIALMRRFLIHGFLENSVSLSFVVAAFALSNLLQPESGLLTVTIIGVVLANQTFTSVKHVIEFEENLRVLLVSSLFIILSARIPLESILESISPENFLFLGVLIFIARPLAVFVSTIGSALTLNERIFLTWLAPRGIVAASVSSLFALTLTEAGRENAGQLVPLTFFVIMGTVVVYGLSAKIVARRLGVAQADPQGMLIVGASEWSQDLAEVLQAHHIAVMIVDTNWASLQRVRMAGIPTEYGSILSEEVTENINLDGIGRLLALTSDNEVNSLAAIHFEEIFGRKEVYQLVRDRQHSKRRETLPMHLTGRGLFGEEITHSTICERYEAGASIKATRLTSEFSMKDFRALYGDSAIPMLLINDQQDVEIYTVDKPPTPQIGQTLVSLINGTPEDDEYYHAD